MTNVSNLEELIQAVLEGKPKINLTRSILARESIILGPGISLEGKAQENGILPTLSFEKTDGIGITENNSVSNLIIQAPSTKRALFLASTKDELGRFEFANLYITGQFSFIAKKGVKKAQIILDTITIVYAETIHYVETQLKYGVTVRQGALTIFNTSTDKESEVIVTASNLAIGSAQLPVIGSGVFIAGFGDTGGRTTVEKLHTLNVHSNGKIPYGVANCITGGIFILGGAHAKTIIHDGDIETYGVNDMVLDAWGEVDEWVSNGVIRSYGASGVGFVNFGTVHKFIANAPIETYGEGARGYNQYDGTLEYGEFHSIETFGNGSVGIQVSKKVGTILVNSDVKTNGDVGNSLVKGVNIDLPAYGLSVKDGGEIESLTIVGSIITAGKEATAFTVEKGGVIHTMQVDGKIEAKGNNSKAKEVDPNSKVPEKFR